MQSAIRGRQKLLLTDEWGNQDQSLRLKSLDRVRVLAVPAIKHQLDFEGRTYHFDQANAPTCTIGHAGGQSIVYIPVSTPYDRWDVATALSRLLFS